MLLPVFEDRLKTAAGQCEWVLGQLQNSKSVDEGQEITSRPSQSRTTIVHKQSVEQGKVLHGGLHDASLMYYNLTVVRLKSPTKRCGGVDSRLLQATCAC